MAKAYFLPKQCHDQGGDPAFVWCTNAPDTIQCKLMFTSYHIKYVPTSYRIQYTNALNKA